MDDGIIDEMEVGRRYEVEHELRAVAVGVVIEKGPGWFRLRLDKPLSGFHPTYEAGEVLLYNNLRTRDIREVT